MIKINLLKPEKKEPLAGAETITYAEEAKANKLFVPALVAALAITLGLIGFLYFSQSNRLSTEEKLLDEGKAKKAELDKILKKLEEVRNTNTILKNKMNIIDNLKKTQNGALIMMDKVSRALPDWVWLTSLNFSGQKLNLDGRALSNNLIADFINNLQNSNYFVNVKLLSSAIKREVTTELFDFKIECQFIRTVKKVV